jgi:hypothetical protein
MLPLEEKSRRQYFTSIEKSGVLQFAAYGNFYPECISFSLVLRLHNG